VTGNEEWHRQIAVDLFNGTWELIDRVERTPDDDAEMLVRAMTSRWHWSQVGGPEELASGDWQIAHVASLLGHGDLALRFAERNLTAATALGWTGWRLASAHEGMARAFAAAGDADGRRHHVALAEAALAAESDPGDRQIIADQLATVPEI
jgi:hypothetical protein